MSEELPLYLGFCLDPVAQEICIVSINPDRDKCRRDAYDRTTDGIIAVHNVYCPEDVYIWLRRENVPEKETMEIMLQLTEQIGEMVREKQRQREQAEAAKLSEAQGQVAETAPSGDGAGGSQ